MGEEGYEEAVDEPSRALAPLDEIERQRLRESRALTFAERLRRNDAAVAFLLRLRAAPRRPPSGGA